MGLVIKGTGAYLPEDVLTNEDLEKVVETSDEWIRSRTGIKERRIARNESSLDMGYKAAKMALDRSGSKPEDLGLVICTTLNPEMLCPANAYEIARLLGGACPAFDMNAACTGFLYAIDIAVKSYTGKPILIVSTEKLSDIVDWTDRNTCVLFGDASGAVVIDEDRYKEGFIYTTIKAFPDKEKVLTIGNKNDDRFIVMDGKEVFKFATTAMNEGITECIENSNLTIEDIDWFVPHQANTRIVRNAAAKLKIDMGRFYLNIDKTGNTSSASVPLALNEMVEKDLLKDGDYIILTAFGGGLSSGAALLKW